MRKKISQIALILLFISVLIPNLALASWWNPFSWFNRTPRTEIMLVATSTIPATTTLSTSSIKIPIVVPSAPAITPVQPKTAPGGKTTTQSIIKSPAATPSPVRLKTTASTIPQDCDILPSLVEKDACYVALSKATKDPAVCAKIVDIDKRNACYLVIAVFKKDRTLCESIVDGGGVVTNKICNDVVKDPIAAANSPKGIIVAEFLKNPTLDNFKLFCNKAKDVEGSQIEKTMDDSRENLITKKLSYYFDLEDCVNLNNSNEIFYFPLNNDLLVELRSNDPDWFREAKLLYNERIQTLISNNIIRFTTLDKGRFSTAPGESSNEFDSIESPQELFTYYLSRINNSDSDDQIIGNYEENYKEKVKRIPAAISDMKMLYRNLTRI